MCDMSKQQLTKPSYISAIDTSNKLSELKIVPQEMLSDVNECDMAKEPTLFRRPTSLCLKQDDLVGSNAQIS